MECWLLRCPYNTNKKCICKVVIKTWIGDCINYDELEKKGLLREETES